MDNLEVTVAIVGTILVFMALGYGLVSLLMLWGIV